MADEDDTRNVKRRPGFLLVDTTSGTVLGNPRDPLAQTAPGSVTKLMTTYLLFDALKEGRAKWSDTILVNKHSIAPTKDHGGRIAPDMDTEVTLTMDEAVLGMLVRSANDDAHAVGKYVARLYEPTLDDDGADKAFVERMNAKARALHMTDTQFMNASGLPVTIDGARHDTVSTPCDVVILSASVQQHFPGEIPGAGGKTYQQMLSEDRFAYRGFWDIDKTSSADGKHGIDVLKTGTVTPQGNIISNVAFRDADGLVGAYLGAASGKLRDKQLLALYDAASKSKERTPFEQICHAPLPGQQPLVAQVEPVAYAPTTTEKTEDAFKALMPEVPEKSALAALLDDPALQRIDGKSSAYLKLSETLYNPALRAEKLATLAQVKDHFPSWKEGSYGLFVEKIGQEDQPLGAANRQGKMTRPIAVTLLSLVKPDGKVEMYAMRSGGSSDKPIEDGSDDHGLDGLDDPLIKDPAKSMHGRINAIYGIQNTSLADYTPNPMKGLKGNAYATADGRFGFLRLLSDREQTDRGMTAEQAEQWRTTGRKPKGVSAFGIHADGGSSSHNRAAGGRYDGNHGCVSGVNDAEMVRFFADYTAIPMEQRPAELHVLANRGALLAFDQRQLVPPKAWSAAHEEPTFTAPVEAKAVVPLESLGKQEELARLAKTWLIEKKDTAISLMALPTIKATEERNR